MISLQIEAAVRGVARYSRGYEPYHHYLICIILARQLSGIKRLFIDYARTTI